MYEVKVRVGKLSKGVSHEFTRVYEEKLNIPGRTGRLAPAFLEGGALSRRFSIRSMRRHSLPRSVP